MAIKSIRFANADNFTRKGMVHTGHMLLTMMKANKRSGDHVEVTMDDGSVQQYLLGDHSISPAGDALIVNVSPGVEP